MDRRADRSADDIRDAIPDIVGDEAQACLEIGLAYASLSLGMLGTAFGADQADVDEMAQQLADLRAEVPAEIQDDFEVFSQAITEFGNVMADAGGNLFDPATQQALEEAGQALETPEVRAGAGQHRGLSRGRTARKSAFTAQQLIGPPSAGLPINGRRRSRPTNRCASGGPARPVEPA